MKDPYLTRLRQYRRSHGLTQDDLANVLGAGGRSYVSMLESGDRIPHVRDAFLLSMLFGASVEELFPSLYSTIKGHFQSNVRALIENSLQHPSEADASRVSFLRHALTESQIDSVIAPTDL